MIKLITPLLFLSLVYGQVVTNTKVPAEDLVDHLGLKQFIFTVSPQKPTKSYGTRLVAYSMGKEIAASAWTFNTDTSAESTQHEISVILEKQKQGLTKTRLKYSIRLDCMISYGTLKIPNKIFPNIYSSEASHINSQQAALACHNSDNTIESKDFAPATAELVLILEHAIERPPISN